MPTAQAIFTPITSAAITATALGVACAVLSVFVVLRRWAFIGEGIAHSGFGGAGVAWVLVLMFPQTLGVEQTPWIVSAAVVIAGLLTAVLIGYFSNQERMNFDAVVGVFLVASLAWGFLAQHVYSHLRHAQPWGFDSVFLGNVLDVSPQYAVLAAVISLAVVMMVGLLWKELLSYCLDPTGAQVAGVRAGLVHYLLLVLVAVTLIVGIRLAGALLVTALIVLPGVIGLLLGRRIATVLGIAIATGLVGTLGGLAVHESARFIPVGPAMALILFLEFVVAYAVARLIAR
jgi:ABC-type Mn2+/Zn2+ transport system permease subunit